MKQARFFQALCICGGIALSSLAMTAQAQQQHGATPQGHQAMNHPPDAGDSASTKAFKLGGGNMMKDMDLPYTGDADLDFVAHMIPHHQGAVTMAQTQIKYGKDPELRKMARQIIKAQEREIAFMRKWQAKRGVK